MIRLIIADDHPIVRSGLRAVFSSQPDFNVLAEVSCAADAVRLAEIEKPDLVTMDLQFATGISGVTATAQIQQLADPPAVLVLTNYADNNDIVQALAAGAQGYLLKDSDPQIIINAARKACAGQSTLTPSIADKLLTQMRAPQLSLTAREQDVLDLLAQGLSNKEISARLFVSDTTVKTHLGRLYAKLQVTSRTQALAKARELGLL